MNPWLAGVTERRRRSLASCTGASALKGEKLFADVAHPGDAVDQAVDFAVEGLGLGAKAGGFGSERTHLGREALMQRALAVDLFLGARDLPGDGLGGLDLGEQVGDPVLEGGYHLDGLGRSVRAFLEAWDT